MLANTLFLPDYSVVLTCPVFIFVNTVSLPKMQKKGHWHCINTGALGCEMAQKLIQFPAIVSQYPFRFAMGAFGCKMGAAECKTGSLGAAVNFRFVLAQSCFVFTVRIFAKSSHLCSGPLEPCCSALCFLLPVSNKSSVFLLLL